MSKKPSENSGKRGGVYQQVGPRVGKTENFTTVRDNQRFPPTTQPNHTWAPVKVTPDSKRR